MDQWTRIANQGADAADKGDVEGTKASCKACHTLYQKIYKETRRQENW
jgi:cytochrome c551/c552